MNKSDLSVRLAEKNRLSKAEAADQVDRVVNQIVRNLRSGRPAPFPGLGSFSPGATWKFRFEKGDRGRRGGK